VSRVKEIDLAEVFAALADPARLRLLRFLLDDERCVTQCTEDLELSQGAVSKHIARLDAAGVLVRRRVGRRTYQRVAAPNRLTALLAEAEALAGRIDGARTGPVSS
jgi:DNA-binding transcriptional ArsR family regulator